MWCEEIEMEIRNILGTTLDLNIDAEIDKDSIDSMTKIQLLIILEEYSGEDISIVDFFECNTISDLRALVNKGGKR